MAPSPMQRARHRRILLAILAGGCIGSCFGSEFGPTWWRLVGRGSNIRDGFHVCKVRLFRDASCSKPVAVAVQERASSPHSKEKYKHNVEGEVYSEWASKCKTCRDGEAYIAVKFFTPQMVQCVTFSTPAKWGDPCVVTTTTRTLTAAPSTAAPGTTVRQPVVTTSAKTTTTKTITNPFLNLPGFSRRLANKPFPGSVTLERRDDRSTWTRVAQWDSTTDLRLGTATKLFGTSDTRPRKLSLVPDSEVCSRCDIATTGAKAKQNLEIKFNEWVSPGTGNIQLIRGGGLGTVSLDVWTSPWFQYSGSKLTIQPQVALGTSSSCTEVSLPAGAVVDADGLGNAAFKYTFCLADSIAPTLHSSSPAKGETNVALSKALELSFNEAVQVVPSAGAATVKVQVSRDPSPKSDYTIKMTPPDVLTSIWKPSNGANTVVISIPKALAKRTTYQLKLPAGGIKDRSGNAWVPSPLTFTTVGMPGPAPPTSTDAPAPAPVPAPPTQASDSSDSKGTAIPVWIFILLGVVLLCMVVVIAVLWKWYVGMMHQQASAKVQPDYEAGRSYSHMSGDTTKPDVHRSGTAKTMPEGGPRQAGWAGSPKSPASAPGGGAFRATATAPDPRGTFRPAAGRPRAKEAEDVDPHRRAPPPFHSKDRKDFRRTGSFTEDAADAGGWVKTVDAATGKPYWFHNQTRETSWTKPSASSSTQSSKGRPPGQAKPEPAKPASSQQRPRSAEKPQAKPPNDVGAPASPVASPDEDEEVSRVKEDVFQQLQQTRKEDGSSRKKTFKFLCLRWHPDKNPDNPELATAVFQWLQEQREWYLKGA